ncbi:septum formation protein Maf [Fluviicola sp. SGL-29]|nr:septum formation protein Maf [Fluviicola sp. SGL-29]
MKLILGSKSPRRQQLLREMGFSFEVRVKDTDESYPDHLQPAEIARYIAMQKAQALQEELQHDEILLTADTIVCVDTRILGKPRDENEAREMLQLLSGRKHLVMTGVSIADRENITTEYCETTVHVRALTTEEITAYIEKCQPFDKAGSYGIQEWFGAVAVEKIEGSYNNVVGLPTHLVYRLLKSAAF